MGDLSRNHKQNILLWNMKTFLNATVRLHLQSTTLKSNGWWLLLNKNELELLLLYNKNELGDQSNLFLSLYSQIFLIVGIAWGWELRSHPLDNMQPTEMPKKIWKAKYFKDYEYHSVTQVYTPGYNLVRRQPPKTSFLSCSHGLVGKSPFVA